MYDELKERCRTCSQGCIYPSECSYFDKPPLRCMRQLLSEAADAIEELATNYDAATDIMKRQTEYIEKLEHKVFILQGDREALLRQIPQWIPVTERLPGTGEIVLVYGKRGGIYTAEHNRNARWPGSFWKLNSKSHHCEPTHWMPLPEPPKEELA